MMRICLISSSFYPAIFYGGPIFSTWELSRKISEKGIEVYVSTTDANGRERLKDVDKRNHTKISKNIWIRYYHEEIRNIFSFNFLMNVWRDIKKADVVYIQYLFNYTVIISLFYSFFLRKKVILCPRGSFSDFTLSYRRSMLKRVWIFLFIKPFNRKINWQACSYIEKADILDYFPSSDVHIVTDGIDFNSFQLSVEYSKERLLKEYIDKDFEIISDIIISIGRLHQIKRFDILIESFNLFLQDNPEAKLLIAGEDDGSKQDIERKISKLQLKDSVFLIGMVNHEQKIKLLKNATLFSLCSDFESFGIVVAEALACGCPVVISDKTPWKDIEKNKCGIFTKNDKESFYLAFNEIKERKINSDDCRNYVRNNFDWSVISNKFLDFIRKE